MKKVPPHLLFIFLIFLSSCGINKLAVTNMNKTYWDYPFPVKSIQINEQQTIAYIDEGKGDHTLLMIHGLGSYLPAWTKLVNQLKSDYRCIAIDLPGYGKSSGGDFSYSMSFFADSVKDFINKLKLKNVILIGHSMGGQIATTITVTDRREIAKLILLAPAGFETFTDSDKQFFNQVMTPLALKLAPDQQIEKNFALNFNGNQLPEDARFMYEDRIKLKNNPDDYDAYVNMIPKCVKGMLEEPVFDKLSSISIPTLILYGANDLLIPNKYLHPSLTTEQVAKSGSEQIPGSTMQLLDNCGHFVQWDQAEAASKIIKNFIR